jgi:hypothetical protein
LAAFEARLHHATFVILAALWAAFVGQVDLYPRDVIAHPAQSALHYAPDLSGQRLVTFDCMVRIDLDLHAYLLPNCLIKDVSYAHTLPLKALHHERLRVYGAVAKLKRLAYEFMELGYQPTFACGGQQAPSTSRWFRRRNPMATSTTTRPN